MCNRLRYAMVGCLWFAWSAQSLAANDIGLYVAGVQASDARAALWVEGAWFQALGTRVRSTEESLGGISDTQKTALREGVSAFDAGKKAFDDLNPDSAFRNFRNAMRHFEEAIPYTNDYDLLARCWAYIGVSYLLNGKTEKGASSFRRALLLRPKFSIESITKDRGKIKLFQKVRSSLWQLGKAPLTIAGQPTSSVYVNGRFVGLVPVKIEVPQGTHIVVVRRPGYRWWGKVVAVSGTGFSLRADLKARPTLANWKKAGEEAVVHTLKRNDVPTSVAAFGQLLKAKVVVLARVRLLKGGTQLALQAAVYDVASQKQLAAGGALLPWKPTPQSLESVKQLVTELVAGRDQAINGWTASALNLAAPGGGGGGGRGLAIGLGVGIGVLVAGGAALLIVYLVKPEAFGGTPNCAGKGACVSLTIK